MWEHCAKLSEVLLLEQEHHVVTQDEGVAWTHFHGFFKCDLCVIEIKGLLEGEGQIAEGFFVIRFNDKCI